ncbi:carbohydrate ABC transporter permease [Williamsia sp. CHRR-6]|uniref:carbohydrate ABC transporter permease n=1 Tax=Williamsia sp. CHRR-6 TaxID=2835871 RepID=UPI001BDA50FD|nr:sugar ABC transporter permease [Williamsia sp. CHRR-6]MBT0566925.1 sugar ABC transporter permease [Williamsia sp. CHRR-6]
MAGSTELVTPTSRRGIRAHLTARENVLFLAFVLPNLVLLTVFTYRPLLDNIRLSFTQWEIGGRDAAKWIGLSNYREWFSDPTTATVVTNTVVFTVAAVVISMVLGLALALLLDRALKGRNIVRTVVFAPFVLSGAAIGVAFQFVFHPNFGLVESMLHSIGMKSPDFYQDPNWALFMVTFTYIWKNLGYTFVIYLAALQATNRDLDEAAAIDGTRAWTKLTRVTLPQLRPATYFLSITVLLNTLQVFDIINVMTRGGPNNGTTTMIYEVYDQTFQASRAGYGATIATVMFLALLIVTAIQVYLMDRERS